MGRLSGQLSQSGLYGLQLAQRHDRIRRGRAGEHRHEGNVQDRASGPEAHHGDVVRFGGRPKLVDYRLDHRVGRDRSRQCPQYAAEALRFRVAPLHFDAGGSGVHHRRRNEAGDRDRQSQFHHAAVMDEVRNKPLAQQKDNRHREQSPCQENARSSRSSVLVGGLVGAKPVRQGQLPRSGTASKPPEG